MSGTRGATVTIGGGIGSAVLLDHAPGPGEWWAKPSGARDALIVKHYPMRGGWFSVEAVRGTGK